MNAMQQKVKSLLIGIQKDYKNYTELVEMLTSQRGFIIERKTEQLTQINQQITEIYQQIAVTTKERLVILKALKVPLHADGMRALFARLPQNHKAQVITLWNKLELQVKTCQQLNDRNAQLLRMQQEIICSLLGEQSPDIYQR